MDVESERYGSDSPNGPETRGQENKRKNSKTPRFGGLRRISTLSKSSAGVGVPKPIRRTREVHSLYETKLPTDAEGELGLKKGVEILEGEEKDGSPSIENSDTLLRGYLRKKAPYDGPISLLENWQTRFFTETETCVKYFVREEDVRANRAKGTIEKKDILKVYIPVNNFSFKEQQGHFGFIIETEKRKYCLFATTNEERLKWVKGLSKKILANRGYINQEFVAKIAETVAYPLTLMCYCEGMLYELQTEENRRWRKSITGVLLFVRNLETGDAFFKILDSNTLQILFVMNLGPDLKYEKAKDRFHIFGFEGSFKDLSKAFRFVTRNDAADFYSSVEEYLRDATQPKTTLNAQPRLLSQRSLLASTTRSQRFLPPSKGKSEGDLMQINTTQQGVIEILNRLKLQQYIETFVREKIDLDAWAKLAEKDLDRMEITTIGARKKILQEAKLLARSRALFIEDYDEEDENENIKWNRKDEKKKAAIPAIPRKHGEMRSQSVALRSNRRLLGLSSHRTKQLITERGNNDNLSDSASASIPQFCNPYLGNGYRKFTDFEINRDDYLNVNSLLANNVVREENEITRDDYLNVNSLLANNAVREENRPDDCIDRKTTSTGNSELLSKTGSHQENGKGHDVTNSDATPKTLETTSATQTLGGEGEGYREIKFQELKLDDTPIGSGAFGIVYSGSWRGAQVAVKRLMVSLEQMVDFRREAELLHRLSNHPNIVGFVGVCSVSPHFCIITDFCRRGSVYDLIIKQQMQLPWKRVVGFAKGTAAGVVHLHKEKCIHRDLATRNLLVDDNWNVRITDFGLSRIKVESAVQTTRNNLGSVAWMAPEAILHKIYSEKSDVFSFGVVLWELVARETPYRKDGLGQVQIAMGVTGEGMMRPQIPADCPAEFAALMQECWAQDPDDRPTMDEVLLRLTAYYEGCGDEVY